MNDHSIKNIFFKLKSINFRPLIIIIGIILIYFFYRGYQEQEDQRIKKKTIVDTCNNIGFKDNLELCLKLDDDEFFQMISILNTLRRLRYDYNDFLKYSKTNNPLNGLNFNLGNKETKKAKFIDIEDIHKQPLNSIVKFKGLLQVYPDESSKLPKYNFGTLLDDFSTLDLNYSNLSFKTIKKLHICVWPLTLCTGTFTVKIIKCSGDITDTTSNFNCLIGEGTDYLVLDMTFEHHENYFFDRVSARENEGIIENCEKDKMKARGKIRLTREDKIIFGNEYIPPKYPNIDCDGTPYESILRSLDEIREYRKRYPFLYEDDIKMLKKLNIEI